MQLAGGGLPATAGCADSDPIVTVTQVSYTSETAARKPFVTPTQEQRGVWCVMCSVGPAFMKLPQNSDFKPLSLSILC